MNQNETIQSEKGADLVGLADTGLPEMDVNKQVDKEAPVVYVEGPFYTNRKNKRAMLSQYAARHKRIKAFTMGFRSYTNHRGNVI